MLSLAGGTPVQKAMALAGRYGPVVALKFPQVTALLISSYELVSDACDESRFAKNLSRPLLEVRDFGGDGLFTAWTHEPNWQRAHNVLMPGLGQRAVKGYFPSMLEIAEQLLAKWHNIPEHHWVDVSADMTRLTFDTIGLCGFGYRFHSFASAQDHPFVAAMVNALEDAMMRMSLLPIQRKLRWRKNHKYRQSVGYMNTVVDEIIRERKANSEKYAAHTDFLSLMLNAVDKESGLQLDDLNIRYQILTFLIAGHETTSGLLSFALYFLTQHPEVLAKAQAEVDQVLGTEVYARPSYAQVMQLNYVRQVLYEALRLWPTAPGFGLYALQDTLLAGRYPIAKRQPLIVLAPMLHRDPVVWGEHPERFDPDNFHPDKVAVRPADAFKPFGSGQRACIGRQFAMLEATLVLGMVLQRYEPLAEPGYQLRIKETLTLKPDAFRIRLRKRSDAERQANWQNRPIVTETSTQPLLPPHGTPLHIGYGSNMGAAEEFAQLLAEEAKSYGFSPQLAPLDVYAPQMQALAENPTHFVAIASTYNGTPPNNATAFDQWLDAQPANKALLANLSYTLFGCGNTQWRTFQAFPRKIEQKLSALGAALFYPRGEADASEAFEEAFDTWRAGFWEKLLERLGLQLRPSAPPHTAPMLSLEWLPEDQTPPSYIPQKGTLSLVVEANEELQDVMASGRSTRHITFRLPEHCQYQTGDYLLIHPENPDVLVERVCQRLGLSASQGLVLQPPAPRHLPTDRAVRLGDVLKHCVELQAPATRKQLEQLAAANPCPPEKVALQKAAQAEVLAPYTVLEWLERSPACGITAAQLLLLLPPLKPRYFSISSSALVHPQQASLTVGVWKGTPAEGIERHGVCTSYLASLAPNTELQADWQPHQGDFHLSNDPSPALWIAAGTGIAPFRAFAEELEHLYQQGQPVGPVWLFFGCRHPEQDWLYRHDWERFEAQGWLRHSPAFSRVDNEPMYVQEALLQQAKAVWAFLQQPRARVYICGDAQGMATGVHEALVQLATQQGNLHTEAAKAYWEQMEAQGRYLRDVWSHA
jgi:cytochrome P450/NADPH-cytochrome P450 reductase